MKKSTIFLNISSFSFFLLFLRILSSLSLQLFLFNFFFLSPSFFPNYYLVPCFFIFLKRSCIKYKKSSYFIFDIFIVGLYFFFCFWNCSLMQIFLKKPFLKFDFRRLYISLKIYNGWNRYWKLRLIVYFETNYFSQNYLLHESFICTPHWKHIIMFFTKRTNNNNNNNLPGLFYYIKKNSFSFFLSMTFSDFL